MQVLGRALTNALVVVDSHDGKHRLIHRECWTHPRYYLAHADPVFPPGVDDESGWPLCHLCKKPLPAHLNQEAIDA